MSRIRTYIENFTMHRDLTRPEWNILKGRFSNKELNESQKARLEIALAYSIPSVSHLTSKRIIDVLFENLKR